MTTIADLVSDIRETLDVSDQSSGRYTDALILRRINLAQDRLYALLSRLGLEDPLTTWTCVAMDPGHSSLLLPPSGDDDADGYYWTYLLAPPGLPDPMGGLDNSPAPLPYKIRSVRIVEAFEQNTGEAAPLPGFYLHPVRSWSGRTKLLRTVHREDQYRDTSVEFSYDDPPRYRLVQGNIAQLLFDRKNAAQVAFLIEFHARPLEATTGLTIQAVPLWSQYVVADVCAELLERDREFQLAGTQRAKLQQIAQELESASRRQDGTPKRMRDDQSRDGGGLGHQDLRDRLTFGDW